MEEKYCIKRTKMNKKGHFAYNLGIWLGLLRASCGFDSRKEYPENYIFVVFYYFRAKNEHFWNNFQLFHYIHPKRKDKGYPQSSEYPIFYS